MESESPPSPPHALVQLSSLPAAAAAGVPASASIQPQAAADIPAPAIQPQAVAAVPPVNPQPNPPRSSDEKRSDGKREVDKIIQVRRILEYIDTPKAAVPALDRTLITKRSDQGSDKVAAARDTAESKWIETRDSLIRKLDRLAELTKKVQAANFEVEHYNDKLNAQKKRKLDYIANVNRRKLEAAADQKSSIPEPA